MHPYSGQADTYIKYSSSKVSGMWLKVAPSSSQHAVFSLEILSSFQEQKMALKTHDYLYYGLSRVTTTPN
jgi:hypothetical protein